MSNDILCCSGLTKTQAGQPIFHNINFTLRQGEILACIGKESPALIKVLIGKDVNYTGEFQINGSLGCVLQSDTVSSVQTPLQILQEANIRHETNDMLVGMLSIAELDSKRNTLCNKLTSGEIRRLLLIREILTTPSLLILEDIFSDVLVEDQKIIEGMLIEANAYIAVFLTASSTENICKLVDKVVYLDTK